MKEQLNNQLPLKDLENVGLYKEGSITMDRENINALKRGNMTDLVELKNVGSEIESMKARLSVVDQDGESKLRIDPVYNEIQDHPLLETEEKENLVKGEQANVKKTGSIYGTIVSHGRDFFNFDPTEKPNYYIEIAKNDNTTKHVWGVDLERALSESGHKIGDRVKLNNLGNRPVEVSAPVKNDNGEVTSFEKKIVNRNTWEVVNAREIKPNEQDRSSVIEYDPQTKQFMSYNPAKLKVPEAINNEKLDFEKKRKLREGEVITLADGTEVQYRTTDKNGLRSNRSALVLSLLLDGGLSYLLVTGISRLLGKQSAEEQSYSKGYLTALKEVEKLLERKQQKFPNDKSIANEINVVKHEFSNASAMSPAQLNTLSIKDADDVMNEKNVNDPDHGKNNPVGEDENDIENSRGRGR
ncbi:DUF4099 domain-containing protein [Pedobacter antarcticus]|uniref:DUF4099 domain-containing protein n=1 Tax=Pedobacter antarcticus TaxID=34086 RepID=UPI00087F8FD7|nr:DUF4099 domain-containing protein [Pedobacter antarcticus]SDM82942.1 Protein of unknown function [Pedobacter antarcticus]